MVLINGTVHKNVEHQDTDHLVASDKFDIFFDCCLDVPGARAGDEFHTQAAEVVVEEDVLELWPRNDPKGKRGKDGEGCPPGFGWLFEKMRVRVRGKVTRDVQITVDQVVPGSCPT